jgi:hypothetical protein
VATYCFVTPFCKAKFCGVPSRSIVNGGCAVGKKRFRNTGAGYMDLSCEDSTTNKERSRFKD